MNREQNNQNQGTENQINEIDFQNTHEFFSNSANINLYEEGEENTNIEEDFASQGFISDWQIVL